MLPRTSYSSRQQQIWNLFTTHLGTKLISIAIAIVLWMIVLGSRNVEATKEIPLEVITPTDLVPANEIPDRIAFRLSGPKAFLRTVLDRKEEPIRVNLSGAKAGLVTYRFFSDNIRVPIGVKVLSINPTAVLIKLEAIKKRDVPVKIELRGSVPEGFRIAKMEVRPPHVRIRGAESRVDGLSELVTSPIDVSHLHQEFERDAPLDLARHGVQAEGALPKVFIDVEPVSANFRIKNVDVRVVSLAKYRVEEKTVSVLVRAEEKDLNDLKTFNHGKIYGVVDLTGKPKGKYQVPVKIVLPEGVGLVKVVPDKVNVTLY
jgi:YbbR domain-containing protein